MTQLIINTPNHEFFSILRNYYLKNYFKSTVQFINDTQKHTHKKIILTFCKYLNIKFCWVKS